MSAEKKDDFGTLNVALDDASDKELCQIYNALLAWFDSQEVSYGEAMVVMSMATGAALSSGGGSLVKGLKIIDTNIENAFNFSQARLFNRLFEVRSK